LAEKSSSIPQREIRIGQTRALAKTDFSMTKLTVVEVILVVAVTGSVAAWKFQDAERRQYIKSQSMKTR